MRISTNNTYWPPFEAYEDAKGCIQSDVTPLYMAYVSSATEGAGPPIWPQAFATYVSCELAKRICRRIGGDNDTYDRIMGRCQQALADARAKDAMNEGVKWPPEGRWITARRGDPGGDRGNRGSLTG
jgi:hypothetical protein